MQKWVGNFLRHFWNFFIDNHTVENGVTVSRSCFANRMAMFLLYKKLDVVRGSTATEE